MQEKISRIDATYEEWLKLQHPREYMLFFKQHHQGQVLATRARYRKDLQFLYGGENDSDGEGYESEGDSRSLRMPLKIK